MLWSSIKNFLKLWYKVVTTPAVHYCSCSCHDKNTRIISISQSCNCEHCDGTEIVTMNGCGEIVDRFRKAEGNDC